MPESFLAALRVVLPMALLIMLGVGVRKAGIMDRTVMRNVDKLRIFTKLTSPRALPRRRPSSPPCRWCW